MDINYDVERMVNEVIRNRRVPGSRAHTTTGIKLDYAYLQDECSAGMFKAAVRRRLENMGISVEQVWVERNGQDCEDGQTRNGIFGGKGSFQCWASVRFWC